MYKDYYYISNKSVSEHNLPLSWTYSKNKNELTFINIGKRSIWLSGGSFNDISSFSKVINEYSRKNRIIIRGCNNTVATKLSNIGFFKTPFACEAIIELNAKKHFSKNTLIRINSLLKRGRVKEIQFSDESNKIFDNFIPSTVHWNKPQLKHLFLDKTSNSTRLFVYEIIPNIWEGAILVSQNSAIKIQGEQFFRKKIGKNGIMETIVYEACNILKEEGFSEFSLGEVPFVTQKNDKKLYFSYLVKLVGKSIKFAYNSDGLFYFKNKFANRWDDLYICSNRKFRLWNLFGIARKSNLFSLIIYKIFN